MKICRRVYKGLHGQPRGYPRNSFEIELKIDIEF